MELTSRPLLALAQDLGLSEQQVVERMAAMSQGGVLRRFGATLRHQKSGFAANVMVAWRVPEDQADEVGEKLAAFRRVSHCYRRRICGEFTYNIFSMVHGKSEDEVRGLVAEMAITVDMGDYALLFSRQELKKTSMQYY